MHTNGCMVCQSSRRLGSCALPSTWLSEWRGPLSGVRLATTTSVQRRDVVQESMNRTYISNLPRKIWRIHLLQHAACQRNRGRRHGQRAHLARQPNEKPADAKGASISSRAICPLEPEQSAKKGEEEEEEEERNDDTWNDEGRPFILVRGSAAFQKSRHSKSPNWVWRHNRPGVLLLLKYRGIGECGCRFLD